MVVGTIAFAGIGLILAGRLRGEINLAAQNGLYLVLLLLGGMVIPFAKLPAGDPRRGQGAAVGRARRRAARGARRTAATQPGASWMILAAWAVVAPAARRRACSAGSDRRRSDRRARPSGASAAVGRASVTWCGRILG